MSTRLARRIQRTAHRRANRRLRGSFNVSLDGFSYPRVTVHTERKCKTNLHAPATFHEPAG